MIIKKIPIKIKYEGSKDLDTSIEVIDGDCINIYQKYNNGEN